MIHNANMETIWQLIVCPSSALIIINMLQSCDSVAPQHLCLCALDWHSPWELPFLMCSGLVLPRALIWNANMVTIWQINVWVFNSCRVVTLIFHNIPAWCALDWYSSWALIQMPTWRHDGNSTLALSLVFKSCRVTTQLFYNFCTWCYKRLMLPTVKETKCQCGDNMATQSLLKLDIELLQSCNKFCCSTLDPC